MQDKPEPDLDEDSKPEVEDPAETEEFEELETGPWKPQKRGETLEGVIVERQETEDEEEKDIFTIETPRGIERTVQYTVLEDDLGAAMEVYDNPYVKLVYKGEGQGANYKFKEFNKGFREAEAQ